MVSGSANHAAASGCTVGQAESSALPGASITPGSPENILPGARLSDSVTLLVADDDRPSLSALLAADVVSVETDAVAAALARDDPDVVVVDGDSVADARAVVADIRANAPDATVVVIGATDVGADVTTATSDERSVRAAVERARRVTDYRESVADLFDACRDRALGRPDDDLRERRREADDQFDQLPEDHETFAAALRTDENDG